METTLLSEVENNRLEFESKNGGIYRIQFNNTERLLLSVGFDAGATKYHPFLTHEKVIASTARVHEYKHERQNGSKFWTSKAGIDILLAIPADKVLVHHFEGMSYPKVTINGKTFTLNVSGGTGNPGIRWVDWIGDISNTSINISLSMLKALLAVAIPASEVSAPDSFKPYAHFDAEQWQELVAKAMVTITPGMTVFTAKGVQYNGEPFVVSARKGNQVFVLSANGSGLRMTTSKIDYTLTANANNITIPTPEQFTRIPATPAPVSA